ncbi:hypothetical protein P7H25_19075 [Paenibacillus larvae]|nr:hypothetical protein [Paenibacillus larvae]MDT2257230.1 hypothetical protein [Paenibacillus larvae]
MALNTIDQFSSAPIALNINQLDRLESGEKLRIRNDSIFREHLQKDLPLAGK